jgi:fluoroquinolone transport system permease protein
MLMTQLVGKLGRSDVKLIGRDRFLIFMFAFAFIIATALRFGLPAMDAYLVESGIMPGDIIPIRLADVFPMLVAYLGLYTGALLVGTVFGFVLLDERDHNTIKAMLVTPVPLSRYLLYRVGGTAVLAFLIVLAMILFINQALLPLWQMLLIVAGASLTAPIVMLFFAAFAANKVQGFAFSKFGGISGWTIMIGFFVAEPWQWLIGLYPPFWISKAYWLALEGRSGWWLALIVGIVLQIGMIAWFMQRFNKVAYR